MGRGLSMFWSDRAVLFPPTPTPPSEVLRRRATLRCSRTAADSPSKTTRRRSVRFAPDSKPPAASKRHTLAFGEGGVMAGVGRLAAGSADAKAGVVSSAVNAPSSAAAGSSAASREPLDGLLRTTRGLCLSGNGASSCTAGVGASSAGDCSGVCGCAATSAASGASAGDTSGARAGAAGAPGAGVVSDTVVRRTTSTRLKYRYKSIRCGTAGTQSRPRDERDSLSHLGCGTGQTETRTRLCAVSVR